MNESLNTKKQLYAEKNYPVEFILPDKRKTFPTNILPMSISFAIEFSVFMEYTRQGYGFHNGNGDINFTLADIISGNATRPCNIRLTQEMINYVWRTMGFSSNEIYYANSTKYSYMTEPEMKNAVKYALCEFGQPVIINSVGSFDWGYKLVVGYKKDGDILITSHHDNLQTEETINWYNNDTEITIVGKREKKPESKEIFKEAFKCVRTNLGKSVRGEERWYYDEWENFLRLENIGDMVNYVKQNHVIPGAMNTYPDGAADSEIHVGGVIEFWWYIAERRYYVMQLFRQAKDYFPEIKNDLQELDNHFWYASEIIGNQENGYTSEVGHDPVNMEIFAKQEVRARIADKVREFREADAKGLEMVEKLCESL